MIAATELQTDQSTAQRYESLIRIAASIRAQTDPRELFDILVQELGQVIQFDAIAQFDEASNKIHWYMCPWCIKTPQAPWEINKDETIAAWVYEHQEPLVLGSLEGETRFPESIAVMREAGIQSICAFPLTTAHRRLGSLAIASVRRDAYSAV